MAKLMIFTQVYENYGDAQKPHWKAKGGSDYVVKGVDECDMIDIIVDRVRGKIETDNDAFQEHIIGYRVVADNYLTEFERSQLEYEGRIIYAAQELVVA